VVSERNTLSVRARHSRGSWRALPGLVRHFYPRADAIAAVSEGVAADLAAVLGCPHPPIRVTYNPVVTPDLPRLAAQDPGHAWLRPGEPPLLLGAGKLRPQKGFSLLLEAFARLRRRRPLRLAILGDGPLRGRLLRRARALGVAADFALPGFQRNPFAWMARSRVFALSSAWEGLPAVLIQAMACGCPVVATDCPSGPAEILEGGRYGALVAPGDAAALADAIEAALEAPPPAQALRERASAFSLARSSDLYLDLLLGS
jgi:glycosyltransferase involved in cell wall biosynthesis